MEGNVKPMSPNEMVKKRRNNIPDAVFKAFNALISADFNGHSAVVYQKDVISILKEEGFNSNEVFGKHWLDVEDDYREAGWEVKYDKPGYNEDYDAHFVFTKPRGRSC